MTEQAPLETSEVYTEIDYTPQLEEIILLQQEQIDLQNQQIENQTLIAEYINTYLPQGVIYTGYIFGILLVSAAIRLLISFIGRVFGHD